jgi:hypothetical protein
MFDCAQAYQQSICYVFELLVRIHTIALPDTRKGLKINNNLEVELECDKK